MGLDKPAGSCPYTRELGEALALRGHNVYIIADQSSKPVHLKHAKLIQLKTEPFGSWENCFSDPNKLMQTITTYTEALLKLDKRVKLDIVNVQHLLISPIPAIFAQKFGDFKTIGTCHGSETHESKNNPIMINFLKTASQLNSFATDSETIVKDIVKMVGIKKHQVNIASTGVDTTKFKFNSKLYIKYRKYYEFDKEDILVLFVGRLIEEKGVRWLPTIIEKCRVANTHIKFVIAGDGILKGYLEKHLQPYIRNKTVALLGAIPQGELLKYYQMSDIFILPSIWNEPFAMVSLEAMSCSLPIIVTDKGGVASVLIKEKLLPYKTNSNLNQFCQNLLILTKDKSSRKHSGSTLRKFVEENYSWQAVAKRFEKIYENI